MSKKPDQAEHFTPVQVPLSLNNGTIYGTNSQPVTFKGINWCAQRLLVPAFYVTYLSRTLLSTDVTRCCFLEVAHRPITLPACQALLIKG